MEFAFVRPILTLLTSQAFLDFWRKWKLDESLKRNLESYLNVIGAVLNYADDAQIDDPRIKAWLEDVKDALYDAEDLLDEILASNSAPGTQSDSSSKVRNLLPSCVQKGMKSISKGIQFKKKDIIDTLNPFGERIDDRMKSMVERLKTISEQKDILKLKETDGKNRSGINGRLTTPVIDEGNRIYGMDQDREKIINLLDETKGDNNRVSVIVIHGMGGLGKTTLAQIVYNDLKKRAQMKFAVQAWACVSDTFDVKKTTKDLLESATGKPSKTGDNLELLQDALKKELTNKRFLLVLDDIWTHEYRDWESLSVPFSVGGHGSKIIVTTRDTKVIKSIKHQVIPHELGTLDEDDCWLLFEEISFPNGNSSDFPEMKPIGKQIVKKCKGLPLAAKTIGGLLRNKQEDEKQWKDVLDSSVWDSANQKYLPALILSYHHLPVEERQCFAYCSLFPKDYRFCKQKLVLLWMAEGFVSSADGNGDLETAGERCFSNLLSMSFFQRYGDSESSSYVMHDLIHDLAQFVSGKSYLRKDEGNEEDEEKNTTSIKVRRFSFEQGEYDVFMKFKPISEVKCLRTFLPLHDSEKLMFSGGSLTEKVPNQLLPRMKFLRVLSLKGYISVSQLPDSVGDLKHLRYLDLSSTNLRCLPDTINSLHNLETLLLEYCYKLTRLPANMEGLVKLRHLRLDGTPLIRMPAGMEKMTQLRTLSKFVVGEENGPGIAVLKNLSNLQEKLHISGLGNVVKATDAIDANFQQIKYLNEVILDWGYQFSSHRNPNVEEELMRKLRFHTNLTKLTVTGYGGKKFPKWIEDLTNLVHVHIYNCSYCEFLPSSLGNLSRLKDLIIKRLDCIESVDDGFYGNDDPFPSLETLKFEDMKDLEEWRPPADQEKGFRRLRELSIVSCPKLANVSHRFMSLKILKINNCGNLAAFSSSLACPLLESLKIVRCKKLRSLPQSLPNLSSLRELEVKTCPLIERFPNGGLPTTRLEIFEIYDCPRVTRLPEGIQGCISLERLSIERCTSLDSLPQLSRALKCLTVKGCESLGPIEDCGLDELESLDTFDFGNIPSLESLEHLRLPKSITHLGLHELPNLKTISNGLKNLNSLRRLEINHCVKLKSLPEEGLPETLGWLYISNCRLLQRRCEKGGADWSKIADLPFFKYENSF